MEGSPAAAATPDSSSRPAGFWPRLQRGCRRHRCGLHPSIILLVPARLLPPSLPARVAPEVLMGGQNCTSAVDLYSFGVVLWVRRCADVPPIVHPLPAGAPRSGAQPCAPVPHRCRQLACLILGLSVCPPAAELATQTQQRSTACLPTPPRACRRSLRGRSPRGAGCARRACHRSAPRRWQTS